MTSKAKRVRADSERTQGWDRAARALAARLGLTNHSVRYLTGKIASGAWRRFYYRDQPNMITEADLDVDADGLVAALGLIPAARYAVDIDERDLIRAARHKGVSWEAIGIALGAAPSGARQTARGRYERLGGDVKGAQPGDAAEIAPGLVDAPEPAAAPGPQPVRVGSSAQRRKVETPSGEVRAVPAATFVEPTLPTLGEQ